jgi:tRNA threonylcarbamoyladenosine biosynthesis protein TsaB
VVLKLRADECVRRYIEETHDSYQGIALAMPYMLQNRAGFSRCALTQMILLVTDTSGKHGSVALARMQEDATPNEIELMEEVPLEGGTFSALLVPQIAALLLKRGLNKSDLGAFIVVSGPGSFTGLRIGLAVIKGFAEILQKPIVPVSLLEVIALGSGTTGRVVTALDAGRSDVYVGEFDVTADSIHPLREQLLSKDEFLSVARGATVASPDNNLAALAREAGGSVVSVALPAAATIAKLGWRKLQQGATVSAEELEANYIRRSDAEIFAKPTPGS